MTYDDLLPFIWPNCTACPREAVIHHARQAAIEFFRRAQVWQVDLDTLLSDGYSSDYALALDDQVELAKLLTVTIKDGADSRPYEADIIESIEGRRVKRENCTGQKAWTDERRKVSVFPVPPVDAQIDVYAALKPSQASFELPDDVMAHHMEDIAHGALARIFDMQGEKITWGNPAAAELARAKFNRAISVAAAHSERGFALHTRSKAERYF